MELPQSELIWERPCSHRRGRCDWERSCAEAMLAREPLAFTGNLRVERIGMETCAGAHFLGRALRAQGHDVRLMQAQYVKPYVACGCRWLTLPPA